ncbi:MAG TPA: YciI family protein [Micromonosporaceae bacterium]
MKYVALVYNNPGAFEALSQTERDQLMSQADAFLKEFTASGELQSEGVALADPSTGKTVRVRNGLPSVTDGPFAEAKEQLAGYYVLETESLERATEIVAHDPAARFWAVEVRPIMDMAGAEM